MQPITYVHKTFQNEITISRAIDDFLYNSTILPNFLTTLKFFEQLVRPFNNS